MHQILLVLVAVNIFTKNLNGVQDTNFTRVLRHSEAESHEKVDHLTSPLKHSEDYHENKVSHIQLPENYEIHEIPKHQSGEPLNLSIQINIRKVLEFDELEEKIKLDAEFRVFWTDHRILDFSNANKIRNKQKPKMLHNLTVEEIRKNRKILDPALLKEVWTPNLFFENLLKIEQPVVMSKTITVKLIPEVGFFEYTTRFTVTLDCEMQFKYYPADTQTCDFSIRAFSYTKQDLNLGWHKTGVWLYDLNLPSFDVRVDNLHKYFLDEDDEDDAADEFDVLAFSIVLRRKLSYHLVQTYMASTFYIIITCLCFLLPPRLVEARIGICLTTLLTLTSMFAAVRESTPIVSYVKAIDIWMVGCIFFVFLTLAQFTIHIFLKVMAEESNRESQRNSEFNVKSWRRYFPEEQNKSESLDQPSIKYCRKRSQSVLTGSSKAAINTLTKFHTYSNILERYSFLAFISLLTLFTIVYWTWLIINSDYMYWSVDAKYNDLSSWE